MDEPNPTPAISQVKSQGLEVRLTSGVLEEYATDDWLNHYEIISS
jgi:hypothetical protein